MSNKLKILEDDHINALEVYEDIEDILQIFVLMDQVDKKRVKNYVKFVKVTHQQTDEYKKYLVSFQEGEKTIDEEYHQAVEKIFKDKIKKRLERRKYRNRDRYS